MKSLFFASFVMLFLTHTIQGQTKTVKGVTYSVSPQRRLNLFPDSIRLEFPDQKSLVVFEMSALNKDLDIISQFPDSLRGWVQVIRKSTSDLKSPCYVEIRVAEDGQTAMVVRRPDKIETNVTVNHQVITELLPPGWRINVKGKGYKVLVYAQEFDGLTAVSNLSFEMPVTEIKQSIELNPLGRKSLKGRFIVKDGRVQYSDLKRSIATDFIMGRASAGLGYLADRFYPELNVDILLRLGGRYNRYNQSINFSYNNLFFTERGADGSYKTNINSFVNVSWNKNLNYKGENPQWIGFGAGYLIQNRGSYFKGNTVKFFITKYVGNVMISPEMYLTDDLKSSLLGIKFNYTF
ncbi:MAG: hypothetical protein JST46_15615 [Bacteroidetes bacterium]|nr:hypothetical protein [Bacteroidota bacterium]